MATPYIVAKDLASGSNSGSTLVRQVNPPYRFSAIGGFTDSVTLQHSPDGGTTWIDIGTISNETDITVSDPLVELRVAGDHSAGTATVYWIQDPQFLAEGR